MTLRQLLCLLVGGALAAPLPSCRGPEDLLEQVTVTIFVVGVEGDDLAEIAVAGETRRAGPDSPEGELVTFALALPEGGYQGSITIFRIEDDGGEERLEPRRCGTFAFTVGEAPSATGIVVDDLEECDDDDDDDGEEGEGEEGEGEGEEGEGEEGEGEGEEGEGEEGEGDGDGEGEGP
jgi:hypothetical protein